jgi:hypothetical protein
VSTECEGIRKCTQSSLGVCGWAKCATGLAQTLETRRKTARATMAVVCVYAIYVSVLACAYFGFLGTVRQSWDDSRAKRECKLKYLKVVHICVAIRDVCIRIVFSTGGICISTSQCTGIIAYALAYVFALKGFVDAGVWFLLHDFEAVEPPAVGVCSFVL